MKAIERLYRTISQHFKDERFTTKQAADDVGLTRSVVSGYLSKLSQEDKVQKIVGRPVYWTIKQERTAFSDLIGSNGSLSDNIARATEAITYPPNGLPIFITGPEGSGKTAFAQSIFSEAMRLKVIDVESTLISIDCSNFREKNKNFEREMVPQANNISNEESGKVTFLLIQNVQLLNDEHKHYLFKHLRVQEQGSVRYMFATTDSTFNSPQILNKTAGVQIHLDPYSDKPFNERVEFVTTFLMQQARQLNRDLLVSPQEFIRLTNFNKVDTITALSNHIKLLCAEAFTHFRQEGELIIGQPAQRPIMLNFNKHISPTLIHKLIEDMLQLRPTTNALIRQLSESMQRNEPITEQSFLANKVLRQIPNISSETNLAAVANTVQEHVADRLTNSFGLKFPSDQTFWRNIALGFILARLYTDKPAKLSQLQSFRTEIKKRYPRSLYLFDQLLDSMGQVQQNSIYYYLPFFLLMVPEVEKIESVHYNAIILAHGETTATSIQHITNSLCGNYLFEAFDMPLDISIEEINAHVQKYLAEHGSSSRGTIVLFDMGSLSQMFNTIKKVSGQELIVINNVTTAMALDIGLRIQRDEAFRSIAEASNLYGQATGTQYFEGLSDQPNIIVSCMSGVGLSKEIKRVIESSLSPRIKVITLDYKHLTTLLANNDQGFFSNTELILTTTDIRSDIGVESVNVYSVFDRQSGSRLRTVLLNSGETQDSISNFISQLLTFFSIEGIRSRLQFLNPDIIIQEAQDIVSHYESFYEMELGPKLKLNLYMHLSLMVERMMMKQRSNEEPIDVDTLSESEQEFFSLSKGILQPVQNKFNIVIDDYEITLLYQLIKDYI